MGACISKQSLQASIANVVSHADETAIKLAVLHCLRTYAASTATDLDDAIVDVVERCLLRGAQPPPPLPPSPPH